MDNLIAAERGVMNAADVIDGIEVPLKIAAEEARIVLARTLVDENGGITFPIDPEHIAACLGISVRYGKLPQDVAGAISKEAGTETAVAVINSSDAPVRQRFTLAHEIGHFVKHARVDGLEAASGFVDYRNELSGAGVDQEEIYSNKFAAELLAPGFAVRHFWAEGKDRIQLREIFNVSQASMDFRLSSLGLA